MRKKKKDQQLASKSSAQPQSVERFQPYSNDSPRCKKLDAALLGMIGTDISLWIGFINFLLDHINFLVGGP